MKSVNLRTDQCNVISMNSREHTQKIKRLWMSYPNCLNFTFLPDGSAGKESACSEGDAEDAGLIPGSGRCPEGRNGNQLQYSCLENPMDRGAW